jgi:hypothetical protein
MFAKINLPCTSARETAAYRKYIECEKEVKEADQRLPPETLEEFSDMASRLWGKAIAPVENSLYRNDPIPFRHGPGQTANRVIGNAKFLVRDWPERLESMFPYMETCLPNARYSQEYQDHINFLEPGAEIPVKVISVPKTQKTPRIIAMEPSWNMFIQQGLGALIESGIKGDHSLNSMIGWRDQTPNQDLALQGSSSGRLATIDLSEASDRVSNQHVLALFRRFPLTSEAIQACRSRKADVSGHPKIIRLAKFASMGSALTFPIEAMVFFTIICLAWEREHKARLTPRRLKSLVGSVRVYGDDIIVPVDIVLQVIQLLEDFGLRVNRNKSFWTGKFRESCGKEYYAGEDVTIFRMRSLFPADLTDVDRVEGIYNVRNQAYERGYWHVARCLDEEISRLGFPNPTVLPSSTVMGRFSFLGYDTQKECPVLHRPLVKGFVARSVIPSNRIDGVPALFKCLSDTSGLPNPDSAHLERSGRPSVRALKLRWAPPF